MLKQNYLLFIYLFIIIIITIIPGVISCSSFDF